MSKTRSTPQYYIPPLPWDLDALPYVALEDYALLPPCWGIYFLRTETEVLYVGASINLQRRFTPHNKMHILQELPCPVCITWMPMPNTGIQTLLRKVEAQAIAHYQPLLNGAGNLYWKTPTQSQREHMNAGRKKNLALLAHLLQSETPIDVMGDNTEEEA